MKRKNKKDCPRTLLPSQNFILEVQQDTRKDLFERFKFLSVDYVDINGLGQHFLNYNLYRNNSCDGFNIIFLEKPLELESIEEILKELLPKLHFEATGHQWLFNKYYLERHSDRVFKIQSFIELKSNFLILICTPYKNQTIEVPYCESL